METSRGKGLGFRIFLGYGDRGSSSLWPTSNGAVRPDPGARVLFISRGRMDYGPANSPFASEPRNPRHELCSLFSFSLSLFLFSFFNSPPIPPPPPTVPIPVPVSFFNFADREVVFSQSSRTVEILNPRSSCCLALSTSLFDRRFLLFFSLPFFCPPCFRWKKISRATRRRARERFTCPTTRTELSQEHPRGRDGDGPWYTERAWPGNDGASLRWQTNLTRRLRTRWTLRPLSKKRTRDTLRWAHPDPMTIERINIECMSGCIKLRSIIEKVIGIDEYAH